MIDESFLNSLIFLLRRATGITYELKDLNAELVDNVIKAVDFNSPLRTTLPEIRRIVKEHYSLIQTSLDDSLTQVAGTAIAVEPLLKPIAITKKLVRDSLSTIMPDSNVSTLDLIKRTQGVTVSSTINYTIQAYSNSWTNKEFVSALRKSQSQVDRHLEMIARTSVNAVSNHAKIELYKSNKDLIDRVIFSAHLDSRTSNICKALDQTVYKLKDAPVLPLHPNERSQLIPLLKGEKYEDVINELNPRIAVVPKSKAELDDKGLRARTGRARKPSTTDRSPLKSVNTNAGSYEQWLRAQPKYYQEAILGKRATESFRKNGKLKDVLNLSPMTKKQLEKAIN